MDGFYLRCGPPKCDLPGMEKQDCEIWGKGRDIKNLCKNMVRSFESFESL